MEQSLCIHMHTHTHKKNMDLEQMLYSKESKSQSKLIL